MSQQEMKAKVDAVMTQVGRTVAAFEIAQHGLMCTSKATLRAEANAEAAALRRAVEAAIDQAVADENERCAEVCIAVAAPYQAAGASVAIECAAAIRSATPAAEEDV
jgi:hypothetical protein